ncbi:MULTISPECIES: hypothetical protein [unclassified Acidocella]|uniref:hypothetical protein n=1 Tax=unclassified Acidocella TaxID=2648610 RepID=UPI00143B2B56|nr:MULTISPECIES: hypothetical protein [unclassified Acidocella]WBO58422.1 hypothetical protein GT370_14645 [Acidocella sp. MX-AZ03]
MIITNFDRARHGDIPQKRRAKDCFLVVVILLIAGLNGRHSRHAPSVRIMPFLAARAAAAISPRTGAKRDA